MRVAVTGAAGFVGSNVLAYLAKAGHDTIGLDNFSTGDKRLVPPGTSVRLADGSKPKQLEGFEAVVHFAANADVRGGWEDPTRDLHRNVLATSALLESCRRAGVERFILASTASVYGHAPLYPTPESCPFPRQTSLYGASKLACEGLVSAYHEAGYLHGTVLRMVSLLGPHYHHGHVADFVRQLRADPTRLRIIGGGNVPKSFLHVADLCSFLVERLPERDDDFEVYNLGNDEEVTAGQSAAWIAERMGCWPEQVDDSGETWPGDHPVLLDCGRARALGWEPKWTTRAAVEDTVDWLVANPWALDMDAARRLPYPPG